LYDSSCAATVKYDTLPPVAIAPEFQGIRTIDDVRANLARLEEDFWSPSACYLQLHEQEGDEGFPRNQSYVDNEYCSAQEIREVFLHDQQDCALWAVEKATGRVYIINNSHAYCAQNLPEFLSRQALESRIWRKLYMKKQKLTPEEEAYHKAFPYQNDGF